MYDYTMSAADQREYADRIRELQLSIVQTRRARRHAFWTRVTDFLFTIPPGVAVRIGG